MIIGPKYKICRRLGSRVFGKCETTKFSISGSGQMQKKPGGRRPKQLSEYGQQLLEKQKARYTYLLKERQFATYVKRVRDHRLDASTGETPNAVLYKALESRLDNVVFRLGLAPSRAAARQMVTHGHIVVNGRRLNVPSHQLKSGDVVAIRPQSLRLGIAKQAENNAATENAQKGRNVPTWLSYNEEKREGKLVASPLYGEMASDLNFGAILEFYSRV